MKRNYFAHILMIILVFVMFFAIGYYIEKNSVPKKKIRYEHNYLAKVTGMNFETDHLKCDGNDLPDTNLVMFVVYPDYDIKERYLDTINISNTIYIDYTETLMLPKYSVYQDDMALNWKNYFDHHNLSSDYKNCEWKLKINMDWTEQFQDQDIKVQKQSRFLYFKDFDIKNNTLIKQDVVLTQDKLMSNIDSVRDEMLSHVFKIPER